MKTHFTLLATVAVAVGAALAAGQAVERPAWAVGPLSVIVTSAGDSVAPGEGLCPDATKCTLRRAIELVNADAGDTPATITFSPSVFPVASPVTIAVVVSALPEITHTHVTVDASQAGVILDGSALAGESDGLSFAGAAPVVRGLAIYHFGGACIAASGDSATIGGDSALRQGNRVGSCATGIAASGASAVITGNWVGFALDSHSAAGIVSGIEIGGANATVGSPASTPGLANTIGNAVIAIQVGGASGAPFGGTRLVHNVLGKNPADGQAAPLTVGIDLAPPSSGTTVTENTVANAATGIRVAPDASGIATTGNHFLANRFENLTAMPVDLRGDGILNPNDPGDTDTGPNQMINYPTITKATQSRITGSAGPVCAGCAIQLYVANHEPGSPNDFAETPVAGGTALTDGAGDFAIDGPAAIPGQWITALVTDQAGNSSEFGPAVRVGVGVVQCGNVGVQAGWNHAGFFGPQPITLGASFPDDGSPVSKILAIYHLDEATGTYSHWIAGTNAGRTLDTLQAGEAYWFLAAQPFILTGGFALNVPLPVQLKSGWNDFVYIGASADVRDALYSVTGKYDELYRWVNEGAGERWTTFGSATTPDWAREFTTMQACTVYQVHMNADATLTPLQP